jgi:hypothetical protein
MCVPHRNNAPRAITRRPHHHDQPPGNLRRRKKPLLTVILPVIPQGGVFALKKPPRFGKIQPAMRKSRSPFSRIVGDIHD